MCENWNEIVYLLRDTSVSERKAFLSALQSSFRILGWKKTNGSMKVNYLMDDCLLVDIALACPGKIFLPLVFAMPLCGPYTIENIFYKLSCKSLILVGESIEIYYWSDNHREITHACSIPLIPDNEVGVEFANLMQADKYQDMDFQHFCKRQAINNGPSFQLKSNINEMIENPLLIKSIVMEHFQNKGFDAELLEKEFQHIQFNASLVSSFNNGDEIDKEPVTYDNTNFSFDGVNYYIKESLF